MNKQVSFKTLIVIIVVLVTIFCGIIYYITYSNKVENVEYESIDIQYGDYMEGFRVKDADGNLYEKLPISNIPTVVIYLSNTCSSCANVLANYEEFQETFKNEQLSYIFLWYDKIPSKVIEKYNINKEWCYLMADNINLTVATPTFFILDSDNKIEYFNSNSDLIVKKLLLLFE